jgi:acid phosphatase type 7
MLATLVVVVAINAFLYFGYHQPRASPPTGEPTAGKPPAGEPPPEKSPAGKSPADDPVLVGAGDIADCSGKGDEATAKLLRDVSGTVFTTGDNAYPDGSSKDYEECYDPSWGRYKARTRPTVGNHEYSTKDASGYFGYFGEAAGDPNKGYYSYNLGEWHIISLNSECDEVGGCWSDSPMLEWLEQDLASQTERCTLAYWHEPRFSSGYHGNVSRMKLIWYVLYAAGTDVVVNGHDHDYERFAPQNPSGEADSAWGIRQFVVGTGGGERLPLGKIKAHSQVRNDNTFGVLKLTLHPDSYEWKFVPVAGEGFTDSGTSKCH